MGADWGTTPWSPLELLLFGDYAYVASGIDAPDYFLSRSLSSVK